MSLRSVMKTPRVALVTPDRDLPRDQLVSLLDQIRAEISASVASLKVNYRLPWTRPEKELLGRAAAELEEFLDYTLEGLQTVVAGAQDEGEAAYRARRAADRKAATVDFADELKRVRGVLGGLVERLHYAAAALPQSSAADAEGALNALREAAKRVGRSAGMSPGLEGGVRTASSGRTAAVSKNTVTIYEIIHDIARPGPNADYTDIHRTRDKAEAERFAANHTHMGRPCRVQVAEVPKKIVQRWGI